MSAFVVSQIKPSLNIDSSQRFILGLEGAPEPLGSLKLDNIYVPLIGSPSVTHFDLRNNALSGFRLRQETALGDTHGTLKIQSFLNGSSTGTDLITFNEDGTIEFNGTIAASLTLTGAVTGSGTGTINTTLTDITTSQISDFAASVVSFRLDQFSLPTNALDLNNQKITNLSAIEFANTSLDTKIRFFTNDTPGNSFDQSGMGYISGIGTIYHTPSGKSHAFFAGANGNLPVEITPLGMIVNGIGYSSTDFRKIILFHNYQSPDPHQVYGYGLLSRGGTFPNFIFDMVSQLASSAGAFSWRYGVSDSASNELMRLDAANGLTVKNQIVPVGGSPTYTYLKIENASSGGYRFRHSMTAGGAGTGVGDLTLQVVNNAGDTINIFNTGFSTLTLPGFGGDLYTVFGGFNANAIQATLGVNEGKWNVLNEASCLRVVSATNAAKIEIQNTAASGRLYEFRSNSDGSFGIFDRTSGASRFLIGATGDFNVNSKRITNLQDPVNAQDAATRAFVLASAFSNPYALGNNLTFNWSYAASSNPSQYAFIHNFTDSQQDKLYQNKVLTSGRGWSTDYTLIGNSDLNGTYRLSYALASGSPFVPFKIDVYPFAYTNITLQATNVLVQGTMDMGGYEIKNALNPTTAQSLATRSYVDSQISGGLSLTLTGAVTGSGSGSVVTSLSNNQTVIGGDTQTFTFTPSFSSAFFNMFNSNLSATSQWRVGNTNAFLSGGYAASGGYAFINTQNINSLQFIINGTTRATLAAPYFSAPTIIARRPSAIMTMQGNAVGTTVTTGGVFYKVAGATTISNSNEVTMPVNNRLQYAFTLNSMACVYVFLTASHNGAGGDEIQFALYRNGSPVSGSIISGQGSNNTPTSYALGAFFPVSATTDYIELWCSHPANGKIITVKNMSFIFSTT